MLPHLPQEYGDITSPQGSYAAERALYNGVELLRLGWRRAMPIIDWATFSGSTTYTLPALVDVGYSDPSVITIRLESPDVPGVKGGLAPDIYLSYRVAKGQDVGLTSEPGYNQATSVHAFDGKSTWHLAWPSTGQAYINTANRMLVSQESGTTTEARVKICKWVAGQAECGTFNTFVATKSVRAASAEPLDGNKIKEYYRSRRWMWLPAGANDPGPVDEHTMTVGSKDVVEPTMQAPGGTDVHVVDTLIPLEVVP
jgi:hypothetical protein